MSPPSYHTRVQRILSELAKQDEDTVVQQDLVYRVRGQFLRSGVMYGHRYRDHVLRAVRREVRARRIRVDATTESPLISFTATGKRFYKEWGTYPLYDRSHPQLKSMTIRELREQSQFLFGVLDEIHQTFFDFKPQTSGDVSQLADAVEELRINVDLLEGQNCNLQLDLNMEQREYRVLSTFGVRHGVMAAAVAAGSAAPVGALPDYIAPSLAGIPSHAQMSAPGGGSPTMPTYTGTFGGASASTGIVNPVANNQPSAASSASRFAGQSSSSANM